MLKNKTTEKVTELMDALKYEAINIYQNPLITVTMQFLYLLREASENSLNFRNYEEVLRIIETRLDEKNDEDCEMHEETNQSILSWLQEF